MWSSNFPELNPTGILALEKKQPAVSQYHGIIENRHVDQYERDSPDPSIQLLPRLS